MQEARDTAGVTTCLIVSYIRRRYGDEGLEALLRLAGETRPVAVLEDERSWSSYDAKVALFEAAEQLTGDELVARHMGESLLSEQLAAPLRMAMSALGSPQQVLRSCAKANAKFSTNSVMQALEAGPGRAVVTYRVLEGVVPSRHDCNYTQGIITQAPVLFGLPPAAISHPECQVEGAPACRYVVSWQQRPSRLRRGRQRREVVLGAEVMALREQVRDLQSAVADLVGSQDLDLVLAEIAARAGAAVRGQSFLLAVRLEGEAQARVHSDGLEVGLAKELGQTLLDRETDPLPGHAVLIAEVASAARHYGRLAAFLPWWTGFLPSEQAQLDAYGSLAAAALDAATAVAQARGHSAVSEALLTLAHRLPQEEDESTIAQLVAEAVPSIVGAASSSVRLWDEGEQSLRTAGVHGFSREDTARSWALTIPAERTPQVRTMLEQPGPRLYTADDGDDFIREQLAAFGHALVAVVPIVARGRVLGVVFANWGADDEQPPRETLLRGMTSIADQAGLALSNVRLLERTRYQATHDALTGLANRVLFLEHLDVALATRRRSGTLAAVCYLDLDGFKAVNDDHGHAAGDQLLGEVADRLRATVRTSDGVARLAGDEFAVLLRELETAAAAEVVASKIVAAIAEPFHIQDATVHIGVSVGVAVAPMHGETPEALVRAADAAMYEAKEEGSTHRLRGSLALT